MDEIILKIIEKQNITIKDSKIEIILKVINYHDPQINKRKFNDKYYLDFIMLMINDVVNWKSLTKLKKLEKSKYPNHYKSIYNKFNRWCKLDVFKQSYYILNKLHYKFTKSNCLDLYIDATFINNSKGVSNVDINPQYFKKRVTKLSALCDNELNIVSMIEIKSSLVHDINTVQDTINNINIDVKKKINIIGDKGYVNSRIFEHKNKVVNVIYPRKSNQTRTCALHKKKLKNRYKIEHLFKNLKKYNRVYLRKEKDIKYYMSFVYLAMIIEYKKIKT